MDYEEDTYSLIFSAMRHPIRRRIIRLLNEHSATYTDVLRSLGVETGLLNYHLDSMRELLLKDEEGRYRLTEFGSAAFELITKVETPVRNAVQPMFLKSGNLTRILILILIVLTFGNFYFIDIIQSSKASDASILQLEVSGGRSLMSQSLLILNVTLVRGNLNEVPLKDLTQTLYRLSSKYEAISLIVGSERRGDWEILRDGVLDLSDLSTSLDERTTVYRVSGMDQMQLVSVGQRFYLSKVISDLKVMDGAFSDVGESMQGQDSSKLAAAIEASNSLRVNVAMVRASFGIGQPIANINK